MNPFQILGVPETSSLDEIKKAYRKLAVQHHPDKGGDPDKFKEIAEAYEMVNSEVNLKRYRNRGTMRWDQDLENIFGDIFGQRMRQAAVSRAYVTIAVPLEEAFAGNTKKFFYKVAQTCPRCGGTGALTHHPNGLPKRICDNCSGSGQVVTMNQTEVEIPKGVQDRVKLNCKDPNVEVTLHILPHELYERKGADVYSDVSVPLIRVFDGKTIVVSTLHGPVEVTVPRFVQNDQHLRIRSKGFYDARRNSFGDHILRLKVQIPEVSDEICNKIVECLDGIEKKESAST